MQPFRQPFASQFAFTAIVAVLIVLAAGCDGGHAEVKRYQVLKEEVVTQRNPGRYPDRMLGAIVPVNDAYWFFKLVGPQEAVDRHRPQFIELVESLKFEGDENPAPSWTLPDGWSERKEGDSQIRYATITIPGGAAEGAKPLELTVTTMPAKEPGMGLVLANVNRWRNQMGLRPMGPFQLEKSLERIKFSDGEAMTVDLKGEFKESMTPPFAS